MMRIAALCALMMAAPVAAQEVSVGTGAVLRGLEKVSGDTADMRLANGDQARFGRLSITLAQCRYPSGDPAADAYAFLTIREDGHDAPEFQGWMIASSPALSALDHPRYDVWVMRCTTD